MLQGGVGGQDGVVRLHHGSGDLRSWVDREFQLGLLSIVHRETFHQQGCKARSSTTTKGVENEETLQASALVSLETICNEFNYKHLLLTYQLAYSVKNLVHQLLSNSVVTTGIIVSSIFFASDELLRMKQLPVGASSHLICLFNHTPSDKNMWFHQVSFLTNHGGLQVHENRPRYVFSGARFVEESVERVVCYSQAFVGGHLPVRLYAMLQAVQFPTRVPDLHSGLADVY